MAIKFKLTEADLDSEYNVVVKGIYMDGTEEVSGIKVFTFDPSEVSVAGMQDIVSARQPIVDEEMLAKKADAELALAKIPAVGTLVTLDPVVTEE